MHGITLFPLFFRGPFKLHLDMFGRMTGGRKCDRISTRLVQGHLVPAIVTVLHAEHFAAVIHITHFDRHRMHGRTRQHFGDLAEDHHERILRRSGE